MSPARRALRRARLCAVLVLIGLSPLADHVLPTTTVQFVHA